MDQTARFALPMLAPGQAQKEWFHNEALQRIDALLCPVVEGAPSAQPPVSPATGQCFIVGGNASGIWSGHDGSIAAFTDGGWRFVGPTEGMAARDRLSGETWVYRNGAWESGVICGQELRIDGHTVVRERQVAVTAPAGGTVIDTECRLAVAGLIAALQAHGLIG